MSFSYREGLVVSCPQLDGFLGQSRRNPTAEQQQGNRAETGQRQAGRFRTHPTTYRETRKPWDDGGRRAGRNGCRISCRSLRPDCAIALKTCKIVASIPRQGGSCPTPHHERDRATSNWCRNGYNTPVKTTGSVAEASYGNTGEKVQASCADGSPQQFNPTAAYRHVNESLIELRRPLLHDRRRRVVESHSPLGVSRCHEADNCEDRCECLFHAIGVWLFCVR